MKLFSGLNISSLGCCVTSLFILVGHYAHAELILSPALEEIYQRGDLSQQPAMDQKEANKPSSIRKGDGYSNNTSSSRVEQTGKLEPVDAKEMALKAYTYYLDKTPADLINARHWFEKSAQLGNPKAMLAYGLFLSVGYGGPKNMQLASQWLAKAEKAGIPRANFILSQIISRIPSAKKRQEAKYLLALAAAAGDFMAQNELAIDYELRGEPYMAQQWYQRAVLAGSQLAQRNLNRMESNQVSSKKALVDMLKDKAIEGDAVALYNLAVCYHKGDGVAIDYGQAIKLYQNASARGYQPAKSMVTMIFSQSGGKSGAQISPEWMAELSNQLVLPRSVAGGNIATDSRPLRHLDWLEGIF